VSKQLLTTFDVLYQRKIGARYPVNGGKDGALLKGLRAIYSDMEIEAFMAAYFTMEDPFFREAGYSLGCFRACLPKVIRHCHEKLRQAKAAPVSSVLRMVNPADWERDPTWDKKRDCPHGGKYGGYCETRGLCQRTEKQEQSA